MLHLIYYGDVLGRPHLGFADEPFLESKRSLHDSGTRLHACRSHCSHYVVCRKQFGQALFSAARQKVVVTGGL